MKVLQINCVYKHGSTGKIVADIHNVLTENGIDSIICYGRQRGTITKEPHIYKFCREIEGDVHHFAHRYLGAMQYGGCYFSTKRLIKIIQYEKPDIVHLHCINGFCVNIFKLLQWLGKSNAKTIITNHAEFFYTGNCGHSFDCTKWQNNLGCGNCPILREATGSRLIDNTQKAWIKMRQAFKTFEYNNLIFTAVSPWVKSRFILSPITNKFRCEVVKNGVDTTTFNLKPKKICENIKKSIGIPSNSRMVFHATASFDLSETSIKGGRFIFELAKRMPDIYFIVAAIHYQIIDKCPPNLILIGAAKTQEELAILYSAADITVITSKRETFSMITAESLCCGTPVVGFKAGGPESIALTEYSFFVEYGDISSLCCKINSIPRMTTEEKRKIESMSKEMYSKEKMAKSYLQIYNSANSFKS